jgi:hypothetical protein
MCGLIVCTIKVFYEGAPRLLTPAIFPLNRLIYNSDPP